MKRQPSWDQFEVALLVDAYIRITEDGENKKEVLQELSNQLREKARKEGLIIDDTFRNLNGMMWQIGFVECAFKKTGYGKHMPSKLFQRIVDLYQNQREEFMEIYESALNKSGGYMTKDNHEERAISVSERRNSFAKWLCCRDIKENRIEYICSAFDEASVYAQGHKISKRVIWDIDNIFELNMFFEKLHKDKIYKGVHKDAAKVTEQSKGLYVEFFKDSDLERGLEEKDIEQEIVNVVASKYVYGYRLGSVIERMKLRGYLSDQDISYGGSDEELEEIIIKNGFINNGKVLIESKNKNEKLNKEIDSIFETGISVIYYESLFESRTDLMEEVHIASFASLKDFLKEKREDLIFSKNYFSNTDKVTEEVAVAQEIIRVWGDNVTMSVDDLAEKLPFIPYDKIRFYLSQNQSFVWVSEGVYTKLDSIVVSEEDKSAIRDFAAIEIERKGYVSLSDLPLGNVIEENYELTEYAILFGTFGKCLSDKYCLHGRIVTELDKEFDAVVLMKQFCSEQDEITLDDAIAKVGDFTGVAERRIAYPALYDSMIRVSEQLFVAQKRIHFDIEKTDAQIEKFAKDGFAALKEITTFALFPECGYTWNHYILESFCYRFSKNYSYRTNLFNGRNAGAIINKSILWDYQEIMAQAVARSNVGLEEEIIGKYLYDTGYMARSKFGGIHEIAERAKIIREDNG